MNTKTYIHPSADVKTKKLEIIVPFGKIPLFWMKQKLEIIVISMQIVL